MRLIAALKIASLVCWLASAAFFVGGMATFAFEPAKGRIIGAKARYLSSGGYTSRWASKETSFKWQRAEYEFTYKGEVRTSSMLCFCLPIGHFGSLKAWAEPPVYVLPAYPGISVLRRGPDWFLIFTLALLGWVSHTFSRMLSNFIEKLVQAHNKSFKRTR